MIPKPDSDRVAEWNAWFESLGCDFCGDRPGEVLERWVEDRRPVREAPFQYYAREVRNGGYHFESTPLAQRAFQFLWRLLAIRTPESMQHALAAARMYMELQQSHASSVRSEAIAVFEGMIIESYSRLHAHGTDA